MVIIAMEERESTTHFPPISGMDKLKGVQEHSNVEGFNQEVQNLSGSIVQAQQLLLKLSNMFVQLPFQLKLNKREKLSCLDYWSFTLRNRQADLATMNWKINNGLNQIDRLRESETVGFYDRPIERVEQEASIYNNMMQLVFLHIRSANALLPFLNDWFGNLKDRTKRGERVTKRIACWEKNVNKHNGEVESLQERFNIFFQLVTRLNNIALARSNNCHF